ncbi:hypothetical protein L6452_42334 [Arctium lappa]|uniref:Uncharacterized protein n=1 Tax=Arctium lappa TaxID=4217 RepID=A0ACB8XIG0_ARCLA|nr:hypothetical protein L6452_42334 [Arctium lappa]
MSIPRASSNKKILFMPIVVFLISPFSYKDHGDKIPTLAIADEASCINTQPTVCHGHGAPGRPKDSAIETQMVCPKPNIKTTDQISY